MAVLANGSVAEDETKQDYIGKIYATKWHDDTTDRYELVSEDVENGSGEFIDGTIEVTYYYKPVPASVLVHHYIEGTTTPVPMASGGVASDDTINGFIEDEYTTSQKPGISNKYGLVEVPANATGEMTRDQIVVTYYYKLKDTTVLVHHYIEGTTTKLSDDVTIGGKVDDEYHTVVAGDIPSKYTLVAEPANKNGVMEPEQIVVTYYYRLKDTSVLVHHYIEETTTSLSDDVLINGRVDDSYGTVVASDIPVYYELVAEPENKNGTMVEAQTVVTYYYKLKDYPYVVNYLEKGSNQVLHDQKDGGEHIWGTEITSSNEVIEIDGYNYDSVDKDTLTITENSNVINIYYTKRNDLTYKVNYLELGTDKVIHTQKTQSGMTFKTVVDGMNEVIDIDGYNFDSLDKASITIGTNEEENVINIYYTKRTDLGYKVNYLEKGTDSVLHDQKVETHRTFESVITASSEVIDIPGYEYDSVDKDRLVIGTDTDANVINIYYTKRDDLSYKVNYLEKGTNKVIHEQKVQGNKTFEDVVLSASEVIEIYGYNYDSADKDSLTIGVDEDANVINLYYTKKDTKVTVHHYEEGTEVKVSEDVEIPGKVFDEYETEPADDVPSKYELVGEPDNKSGEMTEDEIVVIYYYKVKDTTVLVHHYIEGTTTKLSGDVTINGKVDDEYHTVVAEDIPSKYTLVAEPANKNGVMEVDQVVVTYYYRLKDTSVLVHHYIEGTTTSLSDDVLINGRVDDSYTTVTADDIPTYYELVAEPENKNGTMVEEQTIVTYYYKKKATQVIVHHYEEGTTNKVSENVTIDGRVTDTYTTEPADDIAAKYELCEDLLPTNATGTMTEDVIHVVYYYRVRDAYINVRYLEKGTNIELSPDERQDGKVDEEYQTAPKTIENYTLIEHSGNESGRFEVEPLTVIYYYLQNTSARVQHIDKTTGEIKMK